MSEFASIGLDESFLCGEWEDGRPKRWPTLQLRVRGRAFDIYCDHPSDVTLDGRGLPVVQGHTMTRDDLERGWFSTAPLATASHRLDG